MNKIAMSQNQVVITPDSVGVSNHIVGMPHKKIVWSRETVSISKDSISIA